MADISKIKLPNNSTYDLAVYTNHIKPIMSKTFTGVIGTANDWANGTFFYGKIQPTNFDAIWRIHYRLYIECAGRTDAKGVYVNTISGRANGFICYACWNSIANTSYRPIYYTVLYRAKQAGITNNYGHLLGVRLYSSWNSTTAANSRTVKVEILKCENCSFTFFDSVTKYVNAPGTGTTNYDNYTEFDAIYNGLRETGDDNSYMHAGHIRYYQNIFAGEALPANSICVFKNDGKVYKAAAGVIFDIRFPIIWNDTAVKNLTASYYQYYYTQIFDRDLNTCFPGFKVPAGSNVYLVVTISGTTATIDSAFLTADLPTTDDGKVYIRIGRLAPNSTNQQSFFFFLQNKPAFVYKDGGIKLYSGFASYAGEAATVNGHTVNADVPSGAKFTDTTYSVATTSANGLMSSSDKTKLNHITSSYNSSTETLTITL